MADKEQAPASTRRVKTNGVAIDEKARPKASASDRDATENGAEAARDAKSGIAPKIASVEAGDLPDAVRRRYYADKAKWTGEPAYFTSAETKDPAFRDQGRRLITATESQEVVKDFVAIAQHRGWDRIHVTGTEAFRRAVWLEAVREGLEVRGYKPNERDLQELDRHRLERSTNSIAPMTSRDVSDGSAPGRSARPAAARFGSQPGQGGDQRSGANNRAIDGQLRVIEAVIRRTLFDDAAAVGRVMSVAREQLDAHVAAGRTIRPAVVREPHAEGRAVVGRADAPRSPREIKPQERRRSR